MLAAILLLSPGCKTEEEKLREETLAIHEQTLQILKDHTDKPQEVIRALFDFEAESRDRRKELRARGKKRIAELSDKERKAFMEEGRKAHSQYAAKFADMVERYPEGMRNQIKQLIATISRN